LREREGFIDGDEGVDVRVERFDTVEKQPRQFDTGNLLGREGGAQLLEGGVLHVWAGR